MSPWDVNGHFIDLQIHVERTIKLNYLYYRIRIFLSESGLTYFVNGRKKSFKVQPTDLALPRANNIHEFTISKPNNNNDAKKHMLPMKIDKFVTWSRVLEPDEIKEAFIEGRLFTYMPNNSITLVRIIYFQLLKKLNLLL